MLVQIILILYSTSKSLARSNSSAYECCDDEFDPKTEYCKAAYVFEFEFYKWTDTYLYRRIPVFVTHITKVYRGDLKPSDTKQICFHFYNRGCLPETILKEGETYIAMPRQNHIEMDLKEAKYRPGYGVERYDKRNPTNRPKIGLFIWDICYFQPIQDARSFIESSNISCEIKINFDQEETDEEEEEDDDEDYIVLFGGSSSSFAFTFSYTILIILQKLLIWNFSNN